MKYQEREALVTEFYDYWQKYGNDKPGRNDREKSMLKEFLTWLIGKEFIDLKELNQLNKFVGKVAPTGLPEFTPSYDGGRNESREGHHIADPWSPLETALGGPNSSVPAGGESLSRVAEGL